ncbi:YgiQ family radical SAM protein [Geothermobacter hydrogeniphilus]|uniref:YgiQ family radical SAM protein n=1 Tax=Geothermobacter hydrogeniphilus TaxID=1969733 RepID=A0A1X0XW69_9BACT|nr:YgiQ family radical SAM protein [Geothermobacter hydrogeniphilus]ORJ57116.1 YgiQ family radical SAM protein [Geothermobacter hydrogeniphilus]
MTEIPRDIPLDAWLPTSRAEMRARDWQQADVIIVSGDAYVDHPSFGGAVIGRLLEDLGLKVAVLPQPNWRDDLRDFRKLGAPRLFFAVTAGCMDSMVNHYTASRRRRADDAYTAGGRSGMRPDYAVSVYSRILKRLYPETPVVIGGIEASLRRVTHYDYWSDSFKPTILADSGADLLVYGMGEKPLTEIVRLLQRGVPFERLDTLEQTALLRPVESLPRCRKWRDEELASHESCLKNKKLQAKNFARIETESNRLQSRVRFLQRVNEKMLVINPPAALLDEKELDRSFALPYTRLPHPRYRGKTIPAFEMIKDSITLHRGCFGGCSFCTISAHQGKFITSRSESSILAELEQLTARPGFCGTLSDLGGPSANMYRMQGKNLDQCRHCARPSCLHPAVCANLDTRHRPLINLYRKVSGHPAVRHVHIGSGLRYDLFMHPTDDKELAADHAEYLEELVTRHVSGRLKVAPEHASDKILALMRKPSFAMFRELKRRFEQICREHNLNQQLIPYLISGHPGCGLEEMAELALKTRELGYRVEQVQLFTPTPMTLAAEMYATGIDPHSGRPIACATTDHLREEQHRLLFWYRPEELPKIVRSLHAAGLPCLARQFNEKPDGRNKKRKGKRGTGRRNDRNRH